MRRLLVLSVFLLSPLQSAAASPVDPSAVADAQKTLETVLVRGRKPGPGMWRISRGDNVLWLLGTLSPLPADMEWQSRDVEAAIAGSQEVLGPGYASGKVGVGAALKMATLMPAALRTQNNPDGAQLKAVIDPALYSRWASARDRYVDSPRIDEKRRPVVASQELYWSAVRSEGMSTANVVGRVVSESAKRSGVPITDTGFKFPIELDRKELKARIAALNRSSGNDIACFGETLDRLEADLSAMKLRANAWAVGDVGALRGLARADFQPPCKAVEDKMLEFLLADELRLKVRKTWLAAAERSLAANRSTFAYLPISELLDQDGVLSDFRRKGFRVEAPDDELADGP